MKLIKLFEEFQSKSEIDKICDDLGIENYTINDDLSIDIDGSVFLHNEGFTEIPLKFNKVSGDFYCSNNKLTSLEGCPKEVGDGFYCNNNILTSLEGSPKNVGGFFDCGSNKLKTLEGCGVHIGGVFNCSYNPVWEVWKLINDKEYLEIFLDYDMIDGDELNIVKLNDILKMMDKKPVKSVRGYTCI